MTFRLLSRQTVRSGIKSALYSNNQNEPCENIKLLGTNTPPPSLSPSLPLSLSLTPSRPPPPLSLSLSLSLSLCRERCVLRHPPDQRTNTLIKGKVTQASSYEFALCRTCWDPTGKLLDPCSDTDGMKTLPPSTKTSSCNCPRRQSPGSAQGLEVCQKVQANKCRMQSISCVWGIGVGS